MKSFTNSAIDEYSKRYTTADTQILSELQEIASGQLNLPNMICGHQVGQLLKSLITMGSFSRVLEIGTFVGYSAITMADAMKSGKLITLELEEKYAKIAAPYFNRPPYKEIIKQIIGPALDSMKKIAGPFDLIFIDADKTSYKEYYRRALPILNDNGVIVFDNMLWSGKVINPKTEEAVALHELNILIHEDEKVNNLLLPLRDGLHLVTLR